MKKTTSISIIFTFVLSFFFYFSSSSKAGVIFSTEEQTKTYFTYGAEELDRMNYDFSQLCFEKGMMATAKNFVNSEVGFYFRVTPEWLIERYSDDQYRVSFNCSGISDAFYSLKGIGDNYRASLYDPFHMSSLALYKAFAMGNTEEYYKPCLKSIDNYDYPGKLRDSGDRLGEGAIYEEAGLLNYSMERYDEAIASYSAALTVRREIGDIFGESITLRNLGLAYEKKGQGDRAKSFFEEAERVHAEVVRRERAGVSFKKFDFVFGGVPIYETAYPYEYRFYVLEKDLLDARARGDKKAEAAALRSIGVMYVNFGAFEWAMAPLEESLRIYETAGDWKGELDVLKALRWAYVNTGDFDRALSLYGNTLTIEEMMGDEHGVFETRYGMAMIYGHMGKTSDALSRLEGLLAERRRVQDRDGEWQVLRSIGAVYEKQGLMDKAKSYYEESLAKEKEVSGSYGMKDIVGNIGKLGLVKGYEALELLKYDNAMLRLNEAVDAFKGGIFGSVSDERRVGIGYGYDGLGLAAMNLGNYNEAIHYFEQAIDVYREYGDRFAEGVTLENIGRAYDLLKDQEGALTYFAEADKIKAEIGDWTKDDFTANKIKPVYYDLYPYERKVYELRDALRVMRQKNYTDGMPVTLNRLGAVYGNLGQNDKALACFEEALKIARTVGNKTEEASALNYIGWAYSKFGQDEKALATLKDSLSVMKANGDREGQERVLENLGSVYGNLGKFDEALSSYEQAKKFKVELGDREGEGVTLRRIGSVYEKQGKYEKALSSYETARKIAEETYDRYGYGQSLGAIGGVYTSLGQYDRALSTLGEALAMATEAGDRFGEAAANANIGSVYRSMKDYGKAVSAYDAALKIQREINDKTGEGVTLSLLGAAYGDMGDQAKALTYLEQAMEIGKGSVDKFSEGRTLTTLGAVNLKRGDAEKGISYLSRALSIQNEIGDVYGASESAWRLGGAYRAQKKTEDALRYYAMSVDALERIREELASEEHKTSFIKDKMKVYEDLIDLFVEMGRYGEAFNYMERSRSRAFLDLLASGEFSSKRPMDSAAREKDREYQKRLSGLRARLMADPENGMLSEELKKVEGEYETFLKEMGNKSGELISLVSVSALTLGEVQGLLDPTTSIIEYISTDDKTFAFVVTKTGLTVHTIPVKRDDLTVMVNEALIPNISNKTRRPESVIEAGKPAGETPESEVEKNRQKFLKECVAFHDLLIKPLASDINTENLIIVPYGALHKVPFGALSDGSQYMIDRYSISVLPSASVLSYLTEKGGSNNNRLLAFADPVTDAVPLFYAEAEVDEITKLFPSNKVYKKTSATETAFRNSSGGYDIVHLACHGEFNDKNPILSCLLLTKDSQNDGYLRLNELFGLDLTEANLVTLSACETGLSKVEGGDDLVGMSRGLIYAGGESILASLWSVDDKSTAILMTKFYGNWKSGMTKAEALRKAQIELKSIEGYSHPFYWAAFELIGEGK